MLSVLGFKASHLPSLWILCSSLGVLRVRITCTHFQQVRKPHGRPLGSLSHICLYVIFGHISGIHTVLLYQHILEHAIQLEDFVQMFSWHCGSDTM